MIALTPRGMGDTSAPVCGVSPCTWLDDIYVGNTCLAYLNQCDPTNPLAVGANQGLFAAIGSSVGSAAGQVIAGTSQGFTSSTDWTAVATIALVGLVFMIVLEKI